MYHPSRKYNHKSRNHNQPSMTYVLCTWQVGPHLFARLGADSITSTNIFTSTANRVRQDSGSLIHTKVIQLTWVVFLLTLYLYVLKQLNCHSSIYSSWQLTALITGECPLTACPAQRVARTACNLQWLSNRPYMLVKENCVFSYLVKQNQMTQMVYRLTQSN